MRPLFPRHRQSVETIDSEPWRLELALDSHNEVAQISNWEKEIVFAAYLEGIPLTDLPLRDAVRATLMKEWGRLEQLGKVRAMSVCIEFFESEGDR